MDSKNFNPKPNFSEMEEDVLKFWEQEDVFKKTLEQTKDGEPFVFFEGPPTANAKPALHHVEARSFKDLIPRFQTMRGKHVQRKAGWDTHGLPVELQIEKALGISGKKQIEAIKPTVRESIIEFNRLCKESVWQYKDEWEKLTKRMGYWVDMENPYITYHNKYIESIWAILKEAWKKDLVYLGYKVLPYCTRCGTALSSHEVAQGYKTVKDTSVFVKFKVKNQDNTYILSWTTTPWTLPGNVALAVGKDIDYVKVKNENEFWIIAKALVHVAGENLEVVEELKGSALLGWEYEPLFDIPFLRNETAYKVYDADFVTTTDGTGVVHTAVMYGEDDYKLGEAIGLPKKHTVDEAGNYVAEIPGLAGMYVKDEATEIEIFKHLKSNNLLLKKQKYEHEYPHCWRCSTPLLYYARDSWFIKMSALRDDLLKNNQEISWNPSHIQQGRFGEWLSEIKDWAISRERYWGTPLPIWQCTKCNHHQVVGSADELNLNKNQFFFARHGEAVSVVEGIHMNWPEIRPIHLTDLGIGQAQAMADKIKAAGGVDIIIASDLTRTKETAEIVGKTLGLDVQFDERLREYDLGVMNGRKLEEFHALFPVSKRWQEAPEGGETYMQLQTRVLNFVTELNSKYNGKRIMLVTHGDVIWLLNQYFDVNNQYPKVGEYTEFHIDLIDLHRPFIDDVVLSCEKCGEESKRVPSVMDVWFDSGAMPYAQWHYPFENKEMAEAQFPADYISEAIDQTRGWFYTLLAISTILGRGPAYKHVICLGHLLDDKGLKMSKSKGNIIDPWTIINKQGIDSLRWFMYSVNQPGDSKLFAEKDLDLIVRKNFLTLWNVLSFFVTYSVLDGWTFESPSADKLDVLDNWILAKTQELVNDVTAALDSYDAFKSSRKIEEFINELSTWYVRRSRESKGPAVYQTLHQVIKTLSLVMAPFVPFLAENIWQVLKTDKDAQSVHLANWPEVKELSVDQKSILISMEAYREAASVVLNARKENNLAIKQPLANLSIEFSDEVTTSGELNEILLSEVNVKQISEVQDGKSYSGTKYVKTVKLNTELTPELKVEGYARSLERLVQDMRKKSGLQVGESINLAYDTKEDELQKALDLLDKKKTSIVEIKANPDAFMESFDVDGKQISLGLVK